MNDTIKDFLPSIFVYLGGGLTFAAVFAYIVFTNPEKIEKWASIFAWIFSYVYKKADYYAIKHDVQSRVNSFVRKMEQNTNEQFERVSVKWIAQGKEEIIFEDFEIILVMKDRKSKNKNFVNAAYLFTSETLLRKSKKHLSFMQKRSLDLFATKKIIEDENKFALKQFINDYLEPEIEKSEEVREIIRKCIDIDRIGAFFPVLIKELNNLGNKILLERGNPEIIKEVKNLIEFLNNFSLREVGDTETPDEFFGNYTKCAIKIIASRWVREQNKMITPVERMEKAVKRGIENIYVIGSSSSESKKFINDAIKLFQERNKDYECTRGLEIIGQVRVRGERKRVGTYLVQINNPKLGNDMFEKLN